ncbi:MAG TPA: N,N-dimethylformamidase beta subunit family domain-containing protein, partial [Kineosporiaceae bacterium]|nr:N,N-dimethylformamidase beta subunit family domain-containing protein [Kineosporiaceae bacterium]
WDIPTRDAGDGTIAGFATQMSVDHGQQVDFKIRTDASDYAVEIYRLGYYQGLGARHIASVRPSATLPQIQPACVFQPWTDLVDCGTWGVSASWVVPASATSGVYLAVLKRADTGAMGQIPFVVRDDERATDLVVQTSDTTWQAYNTAERASLYSGPTGRAYKVSYNRPFTTRNNRPENYLFGAEFPMIRWLERNGYSVSYVAGVDTALRPQVLVNHSTFVSVGHDEYWTAQQRANVEAARDRGMNLAFFSGNEMFWQHRWEASVDGSDTAGRTMTCYKDTHDNQQFFSGLWTGTFRDTRFPANANGRPENNTSGTIFRANGTWSENYAIRIPQAYGALRLWRNTAAATLAAGATLSLPVGVLGYEWDVDPDNGFRPAGLFRLSETSVHSDSRMLLDYGSTYATATLNHHVTEYRAPSGALVFSAGTIQWSWGLDAEHDHPGTPASPTMQQATVNLFADMGAQPGTPDGVAVASRSTDVTGPTTRLTSASTSVAGGVNVTIAGAAADVGGRVAGVEISIDGGTSWHPATTGRESWTYTMTTPVSTSYRIRTRAVDDSGNLGAVAVSNVVTAGAGTACPCSLFTAPGALWTPKVASQADTRSVELGMRFRASRNGTVVGVKFYKGSLNTGVHEVSVWATNGDRIGAGVVINESASGWQSVKLAEPVPITANTTYIVSYHAPNGRYSVSSSFFTTAFSRSPLTAPASTSTAPNGLYLYGTGPALPTNSYNASNYFVDVIFQ